MFQGDWDTGRMQIMTKMFSEARNAPNIRSWNVSSATTMAGMFFKTGETSWGDAGDGGEMSWDAEQFGTEFRNWNPRSCTDFSEMFRESGSVAPDVENWDTSNAVSMRSMFQRTEWGSGFPKVGKWDVNLKLNQHELLILKEILDYLDNGSDIKD
jgi:hypothetical protein